MAMDEVQKLLAVQNKLGEGPVWSVEDQILYWVDIKDGSYSQFDPATGSYETVSVGVPIGVLAQREGGGLVMATKQGFAFWDEHRHVLDIIARPEELKPFMRFNDGAVDCRGRFWAGTMNEEDESQPDGSVYRLQPDGSMQRVLTGFCVPNGLGWSPDNTIMYLADSSRQTIFTYDFDAERGELTHERMLISTADKGYMPDGLTVDNQGYIWSACWNGARIVRYDPHGNIDRVVDVPAYRPTSCVFGGPDLQELYISSSRAGLSEEQLAQYPDSGDLFHLKTDIVGQRKYRFKG
jgi:sugar lactone lactonase YvrE